MERKEKFHSFPFSSGHSFKKMMGTMKEGENQNYTLCLKYFSTAEWHACHVIFNKLTLHSFVWINKLYVMCVVVFRILKCTRAAIEKCTYSTNSSTILVKIMMISLSISLSLAIRMDNPFFMFCLSIDIYRLLSVWFYHYFIILHT